MKITLNLLVASAILGLVRCQLEVPVVQTAFGAVRGVYEEDDNGQFFMYMGIPYAQAPPGNMFGDPVDPYPWEGILEVDDESVMCPQREQLTALLNGVNECLLLNVYVPANRTSSEPLSVLVWMYGGQFQFGSFTRDLWSPEFLLPHDIIVVTINFRVGAIGYLCAQTKEVPGNAGYKDVVHGLRWVQNNIASFGGNPDEVTLGGASSGSMSVEMLVSSPLTDGLFKRVIMQSGSGLSAEFSHPESHTKAVIDIAHFLGYRGGSVSGSFQFLEQLNPLAIVYASENVGMSFFACTENEIDGVEHFLTEPAGKLIESGNFTPVDILLGFTSKEMAFFMNHIVDESYDFVIQDAVNAFSLSNEEDKIAVAEIVKSFYTGSKPLSEEVRSELEDLQGDYIFTYPTYRSGIVHSKQNVSVYMYRYEYSGGRDRSKYPTSLFSVQQPLHADDTGYLFKMRSLPDVVTGDDKLMVDRMTTMWTNFIKYSNPTPEITELLPVQWLPVEKDGLNHFLRINLNMSLEVDPYRERFGFWDLLYKSYLSYGTTESTNTEVAIRNRMKMNDYLRQRINF